MDKKILSIIVPSYNMEQYLPRCLGSLVINDGLLQLLEVIVVNDGSIDNTSVIAQGFASRYPNVFYVVNKKNGHYGSCINTGLKIASGTFVKILDADDVFDTIALEKLVALLVKSEEYHENLDAVISSYLIVNADGAVLRKCKFNLSQDIVFGFNSIVNLNRRLQMYALTYRTDNLRVLNYHQTEGVSYTDTEWCFSPMVSVQKIRYLDVYLYNYLIGRDGQSVDRSVMKCSFVMLEKVLASMCRQYRYLECDLLHRQYLDVSIEELIVYMFGQARATLPLDEIKVVLKNLNSHVKSVPAVKTRCKKMSFPQRFWQGIRLFMISHWNLAILIIRFDRFLKGHWC